jgi:sulfur-oxidizing protein SoxA
MGNTPSKFVLAGLALAMAVGVAGVATADDKKDWGIYQVGDARSGYTFATKETRAMQDDNFQNPAMLWLENGEELWDKVDGKAGKACSSCHKDVQSMKGVAVSYPKYNAAKKGLENLEQRINRCRTENMQAKEWKYESKELLGMTVFVRNQSLGMPISVKTDGEYAPFYEEGKKFYYQRRGQLDLACKHCHEDGVGMQLRANLLSQGQGNGFPVYRLKWNGVGSLHRRFRGCNKQVRSTPYGYGSPEYLALELYVMARGNGLPVETPAVRN